MGICERKMSRMTPVSGLRNWEDGEAFAEAEKTGE